MKTSHFIRGAIYFCTLLALAVGRSYADPVVPAPPVDVPAPPFDVPADMRRQFALLYPKVGAQPTETKSKLLNNVILDYDKATTSSVEVLGSKVSVTLKDASFLSALDAVMDASDKTCRIECRQVHPMHLSMRVQNVPVAGLLDSLAKLGGARLYVLASRLLLAPEKALTADEKKTAKLYGVLLTAATQPNTLGAKALTIHTPPSKGISILDFANAKTSAHLSGVAVGTAISRGIPFDFRGGYYGTTNGSEILLSDWTSSVSVDFQDVSYGDALASLAHLIGYELYLTPSCFVIARPGDISSSPTSRFNTQNTIPAFVPTSIAFTDPSAKES